MQKKRCFSPGVGRFSEAKVTKGKFKKVTDTISAFIPNAEESNTLYDKANVWFKENILPSLKKIYDWFTKEGETGTTGIKSFLDWFELTALPAAKKAFNYFTNLATPEGRQKLKDDVMKGVTDMANSFQKYYKNSKNKLGKKLIEAIERGLKYSANQYTEAKDFMEQSYRSYSEVFEDYHGIITPSSTGVADKGLKFTGSPEFCTIWTYMGLPSISLPLLTGENNLPLGVQLVGNKLDDLRFLGVANWLEKNCKDND